jgi:hypothetical protein
MPTPDSIARVHAYSARRLGSEERHFESGLTAIHAWPADPSHRFNVIATRRLGGGCVIIIHDHLLPAIAHLEGAPADEAFDEEKLRTAYADRTVEECIAAAQAYGDATDLREPAGGSSADVRALDRVDDPALVALKDACTAADWLEASMEQVQPPVFASFDGDTLAGAAHAVDAGGIRKIGVLTQPDYRGRGHSRAAAYALARHWTGEGAVMEWQARLSNTPSLAVRDALGFVEMYRSIVLRVVA